MKNLIALALFMGHLLLVVDFPQPETINSTVRVKTVTRTATSSIIGWGSGVAFDGSEFGLHQKRYIMTAAHVILDGDKIEPEIQVEISVLDNGAVVRRWVTAVVVYHDQALDIAVLKTSVDLISLATFADDDTLKIGDDVIAVGGPLGQPLQVSRGTVVSKTEFTCGIVGSMNIRHGNSGGPVFDKNGKLVAIARAFIMNDRNDDLAGGQGVLVPIECARKFLKKVAKQDGKD